MKFQPKRFVVEVKRGTSRSAFTSPDGSQDRFSGAEAALFGGSPRTDARPVQADAATGENSSRRILRSLVEPPPPEVEELPPPARRGRKPGSKNKPKLLSVAAVPVQDGERPRRGRKPGSKNKPKLQVPTGVPAVAGRHDLIAAMRSYGFTDVGADWSEPGKPPAAEPERVDPVPLPPAAADRESLPASSRLRPRLRDRSSILKRYVLDLEPRPGQPGAMRARRMSRAAS